MRKEQTFTVAGTSLLAGVLKPRFANDMLRVKVLESNHHTEINLIELGGDMTKLDAAKHLLTLPAFNENAAVKEMLEATVVKYTPKVKVEGAKRGRKPKADATPAADAETPAEDAKAPAEGKTKVKATKVATAAAEQPAA